MTATMAVVCGQGSDWPDAVIAVAGIAAMCFFCCFVLWLTSR